MELNKYSPLPENITIALTKLGLDDFRIGDIFISVESHSCSVYRVCDVGFFNEYNESTLMVKYQESIDWECTEWGKIKQTDADNFRSYYGRFKLDRNITFATARQEALDLIDGKIDISIYEDSTSDNISSETALISKHAKQGLQAVQQHLEQKKAKAELIKVMVSYEMERKRRELDKVRDKLSGVLTVFKKKIEQIMKVICTIELYLGINEEIFQIQDGEKASADEPIQFRQMVLYMDEEIGHWKNGGLDFKNIDWFDKWLIEKDINGKLNYENLLPEKKGVVVFRPRRTSKDYGDSDRFGEKNAMNRQTYLLIRNGDCLYRIYTENIVIYPRLFPRKSEFSELLQQIAGEYQPTNERWYESDIKKAQESAENSVFEYRKRAILMQGLIDRSEVFLPLSKPVSMFKMDECDGMINFIYDDELTLPSGRLSFKDWQRSINEEITEGSRVICSGQFSSRSDYDDRIYYHTNSSPATPKEGIYQVEKYKTKRRFELCETQLEVAKKYWEENGLKYEIKNKELTGYSKGYDGWRHPEFPIKPITQNEGRYYVEAEYLDLTIKHNPKDTVYGSWGDWDMKERTNRIRFKIYKSDEQILNYDQISLDDIDFYLTNRTDRPNYLSMIPLLQSMKKRRLEEIEKEKFFFEFVFGRNLSMTDSGKISSAEVMNRILECLDWWKFKNKWKRPIDKDDTLALRMIEKRIKSKNYGNNI